MRRRLWLMLAILLSPAAAHAHDHFMDALLGPAYEHGSALFGIHLTVAKTVSDPISTRAGVKRLSVLGDFSATAGDDQRRISYATGLRYSIAKSANQKSVVFFHGLAGAAHRKVDDVGDHAFLVGGGGGWEYIFRDGYAFRAQVDGLALDGDFNARVSLGVVFRFDR